MRLNEKIELSDYNTEWEKDYCDEIAMLKERHTLSALAFEHIGSTAIPNIKAKPIIDIMIGIAHFPPVDDVILELEQSGYIFMKEMSVPDRFYFIKRGRKNFNVQVMSYRGSVWNNNVLFRDYMIKHPDEARKYSKLKEQIINSGVETLLEYSEKKAAFILNIYGLFHKNT